MSYKRYKVIKSRARRDPGIKGVAHPPGVQLAPEYKAKVKEKPTGSLLSIDLVTGRCEMYRELSFKFHFQITSVFHPEACRLVSEVSFDNGPIWTAFIFLKALKIIVQTEAVPNQRRLFRCVFGCADIRLELI